MAHRSTKICDNQKWAIDKGLHGATVYHYQGIPANIPGSGKAINVLKKQTGRGSSNLYSMTDWRKQRTGFQALAQRSAPNTARCQADEFPMGSLSEGRKPQPQYVRLVNGAANGRQGADFQAWLAASYRPCSAYRRTACQISTPLPVTWEIGQPTNGDARLTASSLGQHFIQKYGVRYVISFIRRSEQGHSLQTTYSSTAKRLVAHCASVSPFLLFDTFPVPRYQRNILKYVLIANFWDSDLFEQRVRRLQNSPRPWFPRYGR